MSLLLDALKNAERAKANSAEEPFGDALKSERLVGKSFEPTPEPEPEPEPEPLELTTDYQFDAPADPSDLLSDAALQLEVNEDVVLEVETERSDNGVESDSDEQYSGLDTSIPSEPQTLLEVELDHEDQVPDLSSRPGEKADLPITGRTGADTSVEVVTVESDDSSAASNPDRPTVLALESESADNARRILNAPNRAGKTYQLGLGLGGLLLVFALGGYFFYTTTMVPDPIVPAGYSDLNLDERSEALAVNAETAEQLDAASIPAVEKITQIKPLLDSTTVPNRSTVAGKTTQAENVTPVSSAAVNDVEIVANPIKIQKRRLPKSVNTLLTQAYNSLQRSDLRVATEFYQKVLRLSPSNVDALLGMGTIKSRQRLSKPARSYFEKALIEDPSNVYAQSALSRLNRDKEPLESESQLKSLISQNKRAAHLHFNLANLYAAQSRWVAAESAYYDAYHLDQSKPDYAFNLAISLDHLGKKDMARRFYETALNLAKNAPAQFDKQAAKQRLVQIMDS